MLAWHKPRILKKKMFFRLSVDGCSSLWFYLRLSISTFTCLLLCHRAGPSCHPSVSILLPPESKFHPSSALPPALIFRYMPRLLRCEVHLHEKVILLMTHEEVIFFFFWCASQLTVATSVPVQRPNSAADIRSLPGRGLRMQGGEM